MAITSLKEAQQREANLVKEGAALFALAKKEERDLTEEEAKRDDEINAEIGNVRDIRARLERHQERERNLKPIQDVNEETAAERLDRNAVAVVEREPVKVANPFKSFGDQLVAVARASTGRGFDPRLNFQAAISGASESVGADGGYLIHPDFSNEILKRVWDLGHILSRVRKIGISANSNGLIIPAIDETSRVDGSRWGGVLSYWLPEGGDKTASKPKFRMLKLELHKMAALMYVTDELIQDAPALTSVMNQAMPEEINFRTEDAFIRGTGAGQPLGILNSAGRVTVAKESGQAAASVVFENIVNMYARMYAPSMGNAAWFLNQDVLPALYKMSMAVGTGGVPVYLPANNLSGSPFSTLMGLPVIPIEYANTLGTEGDIILADWSQYLTIDKGGIDSAVSMHVRFTNDEQVFRFVYRVDGQPIWNNVVSPFKGSATRAPFVTLATRS